MIHILILQGGLFRQVLPKAIVSSYTPAGAVLLAAGAGASRGAAQNAPTTGDLMQAVVLASTLGMTAPAVLGSSPVLAAVVGRAPGTVTAGNDPRLINATQIDLDDNLHVPGPALSLSSSLPSIAVDDFGHVTITADGLTLDIALPTVDPLVLNQWWNNAGLIAISAGP